MAAARAPDNDAAPAASVRATATQATAVNPNNWSGFANTHDSQRRSELKEINRDNVSRLKVSASYDLRETSNFAPAPVVIDGVMYISANRSTMAIDAATGALKWKHVYNEFKVSPPPDAINNNRGVAYADGRIFRGVGNGYLYAHDATTGRQLWRAKAASQKAGESLPAAPQVWKGTVYTTLAGGDIAGVRGRMMAFDATTGKRKWTFELAPLTGPGSETWPKPTARAPRTGGGSYSSSTLDEERALLYVPVGNAAPDFDLASRPGLNLYTNSIVILDAGTGKLSRYYQITPGDYHDWDVVAPPALITTRDGVRMMSVGAKDGHLYGIDLDTGRTSYRTEITKLLNVEAPIRAAGTRFCPGIRGGVQWNGPAFDPSSNTLFIGTADVCTTVKLGNPPPPAKLGHTFSGEPGGSFFGAFDPPGEDSGWLNAIDADSGRTKWRYHAEAPIIAGVISTGGGLVFTADLKGNVMAFDALDGRMLWKDATRQPVGGGVVTYAVNGRQYIAVAAGMESDAEWRVKGTRAQIFIYSLPDEQDSP
ncbi:PQQ-binding-like beta-propeller repeat protein [Sphingosinicellaceae bacterium]|nr:PQQ-binding-like beta-propeller repeat protein [Sphingosinicellaceae bacterium]